MSAVRHHEYVNSLDTIHHLKAEGGVNYISFVSKGNLVYDKSSQTYSCHGGTRTSDSGRSKVEVLEITHVQLSVYSLKGRLNIRAGGIRVDSKTYLPRDRWTSSGSASALGTVYLRDPAEVLTCNYKLIRGPLVFLILPPLHDNEDFVSVVNVPSRIKLSYRKNAVHIPSPCQSKMGTRSLLYVTNYRELRSIPWKSLRRNSGSWTTSFMMARG